MYVALIVIISIIWKRKHNLSDFKAWDRNETKTFLHFTFFYSKDNLCFWSHKSLSKRNFFVCSRFPHNQSRTIQSIMLFLKQIRQKFVPVFTLPETVHCPVAPGFFKRQRTFFSWLKTFGDKTNCQFLVLRENVLV
jgi:hypothetical protein